MGTKSSQSDPYRIVRILGMIFFIYAIILPLVAYLVPIIDVPQTTAPTILSLVMMALMPLELFLVYIFYQALRKQTDSKNITGFACLMYVVGVNPSIYAFIIGLTDSFSRNIGVIMGLFFSLAGLFFAWFLLSKFLESYQTQTMQMS